MSNRFVEEPATAEWARTTHSAVFQLLRLAAIVFVVGVTLSFSCIFGYSVYTSYFQIPEEVEVPVITGKELGEANRLLQNVGLRLAIQESRHTDKFADRVIISQNPAPKRKVRKKREILVVVSLGPELVDVPDLKGKSLREARMILSSSHLRLGKVTYKDQKAGEPEQILEQKPTGGDRVSKGQSIDLQVQKGSGSAVTKMPNWAGTHIYRIDELLARAHLELGSVVWVFSDFVPKGEVVSQEPHSGRQVAFRTPVELEVSAGRPQSRLFKQRKLEIQMPSGSRNQRLSVVLNSEVGADKIFEGSPIDNDRVELLVSGWVGSEIEVYINDHLQRRENL